MSGASLLHGLLLWRDCVLTLPETNFFSNVELEDIIDDVCTRKAVIMLLVLFLFVYCTSSTIFIINK
jgi:hypothetical protein